MSIPTDYEDRVYAGVLGKIIGVYLGRPIEGWSYERITERFGETNYYCHREIGVPLVVPDDDISGTFTFLRALDDDGCTPDLTPQQIGEAWLNYLIEERTILWWGGMGTSTEHTAYLRLKAGILPPESGSIETNSQVVAEQIGAQIFIDGWGMVNPGDPERAADFARRAGCVSHGGEAIYGAQVVAALVAQAFVEDDTDKLLDAAVAQIPPDCVIARLHADLREWAAGDGDWRRTRERIVEHYGYDKYGGGCHMVPNHALIVLALLYGGDDFQRALMVSNTCGWDTDCNVGNVGCIMGVKVGLDGIDAGPDWRGPVADRLYLPSADAGRVVTDAVREADAVAAMGRALAGATAEPPKGGARYHFTQPGSVQGFVLEDSAECEGTGTVGNARGRLAIAYSGVTRGRSARVATATFLPPDAVKSRGGYGLMASPTLYSGQTVTASVALGDDADGPVDCGVYVRVYGAEDKLAVVRGPVQTIQPGQGHDFSWQVPCTDGAPVAEVGVEIASDARADGVLHVDRLTWEGAPDVLLGPAKDGTDIWRKAWVDGVGTVGFYGEHGPYRLIQNEGRGLLMQGTREWTGYEASVQVNAHMVDAAGLAVHCQGMRRYYAVLLRRGGTVDLVRFLAGEETVLASAPADWELDRTYTLRMSVQDGEIAAAIDDVADLTAHDDALTGGAVALICEVGRAQFGPVTVKPLES